MERSIEMDDLRSQLAAAQARECRMREALRDQPCRCRCMTHGHGCGLQEATCRKDGRYKCTRCAALAASGPCSHQQDACRMKEAIIEFRDSQGADCCDLSWVQYPRHAKEELLAALAASGPCPHAAELAALEADAALDKAELSRIRPKRGDPYFHSTVEEWAAECRQTADLRAELTEARKLCGRARNFIKTGSDFGVVGAHYGAAKAIREELLAFEKGGGE